MHSQQQQVGFGTMGRAIRRKLRNDNDAKVLVVGANSQTGIGKSTFAIELCRFIDLHHPEEEWRAEDKAFIDISNYIEAHMNSKKGSCLMLDEIEAGADNRRATSHDNVNLSQAWATMRAMNVATVATLPSVNMLDPRMLELADYWVLIKQRGVAQPFEININDFNGNIQRKPINDGEHIKFPDLPAGDPDKAYLDDVKDDLVWDLTDDAKTLKASEHKKKVKQAKKEIRLETRNKFIKSLHRETALSTTDISNLEAVDVSQPQVTRILNKESA